MTKITFKNFLIEEEVSKQAVATAKAIVGGKRQEVRDDDPEFKKFEDLMDTVAKQIAFRTIKTAVGPWTISVFNAAGKTFARVIAPLSAKMKPLFVVEQRDIFEIESIPQSDYRGGGADLPPSKYKSYADVAKTHKLKSLPYNTEFQYYIDQQYSYHDVIIYVVDPEAGLHVAKMVLEKLDTNTQIKFAAFPIPNSYTVEGITTHESYRGRGLAMALYNVAINELGYTLVSGSIQTPGGQKNWVNLYRAVNEGKLPGVEITGWIQLPANSDTTYYDELFGKLGGVYMGTVNRFEFYEIPVGLASNQKKLETLLSRSKIKIYVKDTFGELPFRTGLLAKEVK